MKQKTFPLRRGRRPKLSVCMIVKNEEQFLPQCLRSVQDVMDELIVVDTGSTDRTKEIAAKFGAKIYDHPWQKDFSLHRNQSLSYATGDWILQIDADEALTADSKEELMRALASAPPEINGFTVVIQDYRKNGHLHVAFNYPRLYRNGVGVRYESIVHNQVIVPGKIAVSKVRINHYGYDLDARTMLRKFRRSVSLLRKMVRENPSDPLPLFYLANAYSQYQRHEKCIFYSEKAIASLRQQENSSLMFISIYYAYITSLLSLQRVREAEAACREAIEIFPEYVDAYYQLSRAAYMQQNLQEAVRAGEKYLELAAWYNGDPGRAVNISLYTLDRMYRVKYWLGMSLVALGERERGGAMIEEALANPQDEHELAIELINNALATVDKEFAHSIFVRVYRRYADEADFVLRLALSLANLDYIGWMAGEIALRAPALNSRVAGVGEALLRLLAGVNEMPTARGSQSAAELALRQLMDPAAEEIDPEKFLETTTQIVGMLRAMDLSAFVKLLPQPQIYRGELALLAELGRLYRAAQQGDADALAGAMREAANCARIAAPAALEDVKQVLQFLTHVSRAADRLGWPDAAATALAVAEVYFTGLPQIQALRMRRKIARVERDNAFDPRLRFALKFILPLTDLQPQKKAPPTEQATEAAASW